MSPETFPAPVVVLVILLVPLFVLVYRYAKSNQRKSEKRRAAVSAEHKATWENANPGGDYYSSSAWAAVSADSSSSDCSSDSGSSSSSSCD